MSTMDTETQLRHFKMCVEELQEENSKLKNALTESNDILSWMLENADVPNSLHSHFYNGTTNVIEQNKELIEA